MGGLRLGDPIVGLRACRADPRRCAPLSSVAIRETPRPGEPFAPVAIAPGDAEPRRPPEVRSPWVRPAASPRTCDHRFLKWRAGPPSDGVGESSEAGLSTVGPPRLAGLELDGGGAVIAAEPPGWTLTALSVGRAQFSVPEPMIGVDDDEGTPILRCRDRDRIPPPLPAQPSVLPGRLSGSSASRERSGRQGGLMPPPFASVHDAERGPRGFTSERHQKLTLG